MSPYKVKGKCVFMQKAGRWIRLKCHSTAKKARAHAYALKMNVGHK